jgi:hypothetical protein
MRIRATRAPARHVVRKDANVDDAQFDDLSRRLGMSEPQEGAAGAGTPQTLSASRGRRTVLGSLGAAGVAAVTALGLQTTTAKKQKKNTHQHASA